MRLMKGKPPRPATATVAPPLIRLRRLTADDNTRDEVLVGRSVMVSSLLIGFWLRTVVRCFRSARLLKPCRRGAAAKARPRYAARPDRLLPAGRAASWWRAAPAPSGCCRRG